MKLTERILLAIATVLAKLTGLDELLDAITLPLAFIEYYREQSPWYREHVRQRAEEEFLRTKAFVEQEKEIWKPLYLDALEKFTRESKE